MAKPKALVLCGDGINCENETAYALNLAGAIAEICHINQLIESPHKLIEAEILALPGGFSFGDEVSSGKLLALKLKHQLNDSIQKFIEQQNTVIGICNGFQALVKLGLLPDENLMQQQVSLVHNRQRQFINRWVSLNIDNKSHPFFKDIDALFELPIRHGEGRLVLSDSKDSAEKIQQQKALSYTQDVNGSFANIAGLISNNGYVFGLMPHPEAFVRWTQHPNWQQLSLEVTAKTPPGLKLFQNIVERSA
jgi:phosphoribosylformylglycinamidine synthase